MGFAELVRTNFDIVQTGWYSHTELGEMVPFEWEICMNQVFAKIKEKNELAKGK